MKFNDWITEKYVDWRGNAIGRERSIKEFSDWIGVSNQLMTYWMMQDGKIPKHKKTIDKLVNKFGSEVYVVLEIPSPPLFIQKLEAIYDKLTPEQRQSLSKRISDILSDYLKSNA